MVTKPLLLTSMPNLGFCSSEKINGNKTQSPLSYSKSPFCSSEKINGNKTGIIFSSSLIGFCSSEKINGNKTRSRFDFISF